MSKDARKLHIQDISYLADQLSGLETREDLTTAELDAEWEDILNCIEARVKALMTMGREG